MPGPPDLLARIDALEPTTRERNRLTVLAESEYVDFAAAAFGCQKRQIRECLRELSEDDELFYELVPRIAQLDLMKSSGDLRLHSVTCYLAARCNGSEANIFETGVASGKSSSYLLAALHHTPIVNRLLISVDLPADGSRALDGSDTGLEGNEIGWLIPNWLRERWRLLLGPSTEMLPAAFEAFGPPGVFLHDSLHTYENTLLELCLALSANPDVILLCDNLEMGSGAAFSEITEAQDLHSFVFGNFGIARRK